MYPRSSSSSLSTPLFFCWAGWILRTISGGGALERVLLDGEDERLDGEAGRPSSEIFCRGRRPSLATEEKRDGREIKSDVSAPRTGAAGRARDLTEINLVSRTGAQSVGGRRPQHAARRTLPASGLCVPDDLVGPLATWHAAGGRVQET